MTTWTEQRIATAITSFVAEFNREPSNDDFVNNPSLPHPRLVQRNFGGLVALREKLGLNTKNFTEGAVRSNQIKKILSSSRKEEAKIFNKLYENLDTSRHLHDLPLSKDLVYVSRQMVYQQYKPGAISYTNTSSDIAIDNRTKRHLIFLDLFNPKDTSSLIGCINIKKKKIETSPIYLSGNYTHTLYFVCTNKNITQEQIDAVIKPSALYSVVAYSNFMCDIIKQ